MNRISFAIWLMFVPVVGAIGQARESAPVVLRSPGSTRAMALGNVFVLSGQDPDAIFYNPAMISQTGGAGLAIESYGAASILANVSAGRSWSSGGLAIGLQVLEYGASADDLTGLPPTEAGLLTRGPEGASDIVASIAYAREIVGFRFGLGAKFIDQQVSGARDATGAVDLGIVKDVGPIVLGLAGRNMGPGLEIRGTSLPLPLDVTLGATLPSEQIGPLDIVATAAVTRWRDGEFIPAGGVELSWWPVQGRTFTGRVGAQRVPGGDQSPVTFGLAFTGDNITIEYAFQAYQSEGSAHRFGLRWR